MPRIRSVHPDICEDDTLAEISAYAERTFVRLWTHLDDEGRAVDGAKLWKARLYPLHDSMTVERVEKDLSELEEKGLLQRYEVEGKRYLRAKPEPWKRWQRPQRPTPSKLPAPSRTPRVPLAEPSRGTPPVVEGRGDVSGAKKEGESEGEGASTASCGRPLADSIARASARASGSPVEVNHQ